MKTIFKLLFLVLAITTIARFVPVNDPIATYAFIGLSVAVTGAVLIPARYFNTGTLGVLDVTVWKKYVIEKLRRANAFIFKSKDDTRYVLGGLTVVIPQSGADPTITLNNSSWPLTATRRTDTDVSYNLDSFSTTPHHIPWSELQTLSYDKIDSIIGQHTASLVEAVADKMVINWAPTVAGKQIATTGADVNPATGQTGTRKLFHPKDLLKAMSAFNKANIPDNGRFCLIDAHMYEGFYDQLTDSQANAYNQFADNKTGQVGKLHSFNIFVRSKALVYANGSATPKAYGSSIAATDNLASLCWHEDMVCRAVGEMKPFVNKDDALYQGDIYSMIVRFGGRKEREDNEGVVAIVQAQ